MGGATVEGMIKADYFDNKDLMVSDPAEVVLKKFSAQGIRTTTDRHNFCSCHAEARQHEHNTE